MNARAGGRAAGRRAGIGGLPAINPQFEAWLADVPADGPVLDFGCGRGFWMRRLRADGRIPVGLEPDPARAAEAAAHGPVTVGDGQHLPHPAAAFGAVWCVHALHHLGDPGAAVAEMARILRPGGTLLLAETVEDHPAIRLARRIHPEWDGVAVAARFTAAALLAQLADHGFVIERQRHHSLVSFGAWALPVGQRPMWQALSRAEERLPARWSRWGAHLEVRARRA